MVKLCNKKSQIKLHSVFTPKLFSRTTVTVLSEYFRVLLPQMYGQDYRNIYRPDTTQKAVRNITANVKCNITLF
jgi:hypothetical protein